MFLSYFIMCIHVILNLTFPFSFILYVWVFYQHIYLYLVHAWNPQGEEEGIRVPELEL